MKEELTMDFNGKTAVITGGATGIGRACAVKFAKHGANVVVVDINRENLEKVRKELNAYTENIMVCECDVSDEEKVYKTVMMFEKSSAKRIFS